MMSYALIGSECLGTKFVIFVMTLILFAVNSAHISDAMCSLSTVLGHVALVPVLRWTSTRIDCHLYPFWTSLEGLSYFAIHNDSIS